MHLLFAVTISASLLSFIAAAKTVYSKDETPMEKQASWISDVQGWKPVTDQSLYNSSTIFQYMNGAAELYLAYNFRELKTVRLEKPGMPSIAVEVYDMASPEDAYGVFTFEQQDPGAGIGQGSEFGGGLLRFWKGRYFVTIFGEEPGRDIEEAILTLGRRIDASIRDSGNPPKIIGYLPDNALTFSKKDAWFFRSHIHLNQRFFVARANILMLAPDVEAVLSRYETKGGRVHILLIRYPTPNKADAAVVSFRDAYMPDAGNEDSIQTENDRWTSVSRFHNFVVVVFDTPDKLLSKNLIKATEDILKREGL